MRVRRHGGVFCLFLFLWVGVGGEADVEGLDGVGFGFAVGAVTPGGGAVGFDYIFFFEV